MFSVKKRRIWGKIIVAFNYLKEAYMKDRERLFTRAHSDRTRNKCFKLRKRRFRLEILCCEEGETLA